MGRIAAAGLAAAAVAGCVSAKGASYAETLAVAGPPPAKAARIVLLRPDQRYDDASLSRVVLRINGRVLGKLAYGGFLLADVPAGETILEVSADNRSFGTCKRTLQVAAGDTLYFDVAPRPANIAVGTIGTVAGGAVAGGATAAVPQAGADGAIVGAIASAAEGASRPCGGPYRMTPLAAVDALEQLDRLRASD